MIKELEINWLTQATGDPFTDVGGYVWAYLSNKFPNKEPIEIIEYVAKIYIYDWEQKIHPFFANSKITHNSYGGKKEKSLTDTVMFYRRIFDEADESVIKRKGFCRITGRQGAVYSAERSTTILSGAGSLMNFHHAFESGSMVSKEVLLRNFVMPLGVIQVGSLPAIIISNDEKVSNLIAGINCQAHLDALGGGSTNKGLIKSNASNPANALFQYVINIHKKIEYELDIDSSDTKKVALNLFHFSNFVNGVALNMYTLSEAGFEFYTYCLKKYKFEWLNFVNAHYKIGEPKKKDKTEEIVETVIESHYNPILSKIMIGENLSSFFLNWLLKGNKLNFKIIEIYQIIIRNMDKRTLNVLRTVATFVAQKCSDDDITKTLRKLNSATSRQDVFFTLLKLVEKNKDNEEPIIRLDDVEFLFPEGFHWREMRNILLIAIYEYLHEANRKVVDGGELPEMDKEGNSEKN